MAALGMDEEPMLAALGSRDRTVQLSGPRSGSMLKGVDKRPSVEENATSILRVHRLDGLFDASGPWAGERFAFGHFDVEGERARRRANV